MKSRHAERHPTVYEKKTLQECPNKAMHPHAWPNWSYPPYGAANSGTNRSIKAPGA